MMRSNECCFKGAGTSTPWGVSQASYPVIRGAVFYTTAGHGGLRVSERLANSLSEYARLHAIHLNGAYWFEEDCAMVLPMFEFLVNMPKHTMQVMEWCGSGRTVEEQKEILVELLGRWFKDYRVA